MGINFFQLLGYAPDDDSTKPGVISDASAIRPTVRGYASAFSATLVGDVQSGATTMTLGTLAATCVGAFLARNTADVERLYAGTTTKIYRAANTPGPNSFTDVGRASTYSANIGAPWRFAQFGDVVLAANLNTTIQASTLAGNFSCISSAPQAVYIETVGQFVFAANTNDAIYGVSSDRWWCCAIGDHTNWTPAVATQCATGRLLSSNGVITGLKRFGDDILIYKRKAIYRGTYVGPPVVWSFEKLPGDIGAIEGNCIIDIGALDSPRHFFVSTNGFFIYDGSRIAPIGIGVVENQFLSTSPIFLLSSGIVNSVIKDEKTSLIYIFYRTTSSVAALPDSCLIYNYKLNKWGTDNRTNVTCPVEFKGSSEGNKRACFFGTDNMLYYLSGTSSASSTLTLGDYGSEEQETLLRRVRPRFLTKPTSATMSDIYRQSAGNTGVTSTAATMASSGNFDLLQEARFHRPTFSMTGNWEMDGVSFDAEPTGTE